MERYCQPIRTFDDFWGRAGLPNEIRLEAEIAWNAALEAARAACATKQLFETGTDAVSVALESLKTRS